MGLGFEAGCAEGYVGCGPVFGVAGACAAGGGLRVEFCSADDTRGRFEVCVEGFSGASSPCSRGCRRESRFDRPHTLDPGDLLIPLADVSADEVEDPLQRGNEVLGYVVFRVEGEASIFEECLGRYAPVDQSRPRRAGNDDVGDAFTVLWFEARVFEHLLRADERARRRQGFLAVCSQTDFFREAEILD